MPKPDPLARSLIMTCQELQRRRCWERVVDDAPFLLRVPTEEEPLAGMLIPPDGEGSFGLMLSCGEEALDRLYQSVLRPDLEELDAEGLDLLCAYFERLGELPDDLRQPLQQARFQARRESVVPYAFRRAPGRESRPPNRRETKTLIWCMRAIFAAEDAGELEPRVLHPEFPVLQLEASGAMRAPEVVARFVPWEASEVGEEFELRLPADLLELPRVEERWLATVPLVPGRREGDDRGYNALLLQVEGTPEMVCTHFVPRGEEELFLPALEQALRERGRPREVAFSYRDEMGLLEPPLSLVGVGVALEPFDPRFELLREALLRGLYEPGGSEVTWHAPDSPEEWELLDRDYAHRQLGWLTQTDRIGSGLAERYFGDGEDPDELVGALFELRPFDAYLEWLVTDYRESEGTETILEERLERSDLLPVDRTMMEARVGALLSIFRVLEPEDDGVLELELEDVIDGRRYTVEAERFLLSGVEGLCQPLRLLRLGEWFHPLVAGPPIAPEALEEAMQWLEALGVELTHEGLRERSHLVGRLWAWHLERMEDDEDVFDESSSELTTDEDLEEFVIERARAWLDEATPTFGGRTPREAARTEEGRKKVERLLREMPSMSLTGGVVRVPVEEVMRELGPEGG